MNLKSDEYVEMLKSSQKKIIINNKFFKITNDPLLLADFCNKNIKKNGIILDIGAGSGILPLLLIKNPYLTSIHGIEIQEKIFEYFQKNILFNNAENKIISYNSNVKHFSPGFEFDYIISNPPYYKKNSGPLSLNKEISISKFEIELTLEDLIFNIKRLLKNHGKFYLIIIPERLNDILKAIYNNKLNILKMSSVIYGKKIKFILIEGQKGGNPGNTVLEQIFL